MSYLRRLNIDANGLHMQVVLGKLQVDHMGRLGFFNMRAGRVPFWRLF